MIDNIRACGASIGGPGRNGRFFGHLDAVYPPRQHEHDGNPQHDAEDDFEQVGFGVGVVGHKESAHLPKRIPPGSVRLERGGRVSYGLGAHLCAWREDGTAFEEARQPHPVVAFTDLKHRTRGARLNASVCV